MKLNWNTVLLTCAIGVSGWAGREIYNEIRSTHDTVLVIKTQMISRSEYDIAMAEVKTRLTALEWEVQKAKDRKP